MSVTIISISVVLILVSGIDGFEVLVLYVGGDCSEKVADDDANPLLTLETGNATDYALEWTCYHTYQLSFGEFPYNVGSDVYVVLCRLVDCAEAPQLNVGHDERLVDEFAVPMIFVVVEAQVWEMDVVVDESLQFLPCGIGEEDVGYQRLFLEFNPAIPLMGDGVDGPEEFDILIVLRNIVARLPLASPCRTKYVPMWFPDKGKWGLRLWRGHIWWTPLFVNFFLFTGRNFGEGIGGKPAAC